MEAVVNTTIIGYVGITLYLVYSVILRYRELRLVDRYTELFKECLEKGSTLQINTDLKIIAEVVKPFVDRGYYLTIKVEEHVITIYFDNSMG